MLFITKMRYTALTPLSTEPANLLSESRRAFYQDGSWKVGYRPLPLTNKPINIGDSGYRVLVWKDKIFETLKFNAN